MIHKKSKSLCHMQKAQENPRSEAGKDQVRAAIGVEDQRDKPCPSHLLYNPKASQEVTQDFALGKQACISDVPEGRTLMLS